MRPNLDNNVPVSPRNKHRNNPPPPCSLPTQTKLQPQVHVQSEINQRNMRFSHVAVDALVKPLEIAIKDPAVLFVQIYTAIIYGIYHSLLLLLLIKFIVHTEP